MQKKSVLTLAQNKPRILQPSVSPRFSASNSRPSSSVSLTKAPIKPLKRLQKAPSALNKPKVSFPATTPLKGAKKEDVKELLIKKCKISCQKVNPTKSEMSMFVMAKTDYLKEILNSLKDPKFPLPQEKEVYSSIFSLIATHIFNSGKNPPILWDSVHDDYYFEMDKELEDDYWCFNSLIYDIAIAFIEREDFDIELVNTVVCDLFKLVVYLMRTFYVEEQKKQELLFVAIYKKMGKLRKFGLTVADSALLRISVNEDCFVAAKPLLAVYRSIADGFKVPMKRSHIDFFYSVILPLHKHEHSHYFWAELVGLVTSYLEKDEELTIDTIKCMMSFWPKTNTTKQIDFVEELGILASYVPDDKTTEVVRIMSSQFNNTVMGVNTIVAKRMLALFCINDFVWLITEKPGDSYPLLIPSIFTAARVHWDKDTRDIALSVLNVLQENNEKIFRIVGKALKALENQKIMATMERGLKWQILIDNFETNKKARRLKTKQLSRIFVGCEKISHKHK